MEERSVFRKIGSNIAWIIGAILGVAIIKYVWVSVGLVCLCLYVMSRLMKNKNEYIRRSIAIQTGHLLWITIGMVSYYVLYNQNRSDLLIDIVIMLIGIILLYFKPGIVTIVFLTIYNLISIYSNGLGFVEAVNLNASGNLIFVLLTHVVLRVIAILFMFIGYKQIRQSKGKVKTENIASSEEQSDIKTKLKELEELKTENLITNDEYVSKRSQIIDRI